MHGMKNVCKNIFFEHFKSEDHSGFLGNVSVKTYR